MKVTIEFSGIASSLAGMGELTLEIPEGTTYREIVRELAVRYPDMVNILIDPDGENFLSSVMFIIDGDLANPVMLIEKTPHDGERIHLMSVITGG